MRWLLPLVAALALVGSSVTTWASAGLVGDTECCCPDPETCPCHDHDGEPSPEPTLERCGGEVALVAPHVLRGVLATPVIAPAPRVATRVDAAPPPLLDHDPEPPEKPPF